MSDKQPSPVSRRSFLKAVAAAPLVPGIASTKEATAVESSPKLTVRPITSGPKFHFFGYYDKFQVEVSAIVGEAGE